MQTGPSLMSVIWAGSKYAKGEPLVDIYGNQDPQANFAEQTRQAQSSENSNWKFYSNSAPIWVYY